MPRTRTGWLIWAWGIGGVVLLLLNAVRRLSPHAVETMSRGLSPTQQGLAVLWVLFMLYSEAYRGFHKQFAPRVVVRTLALADQPSLGLGLLAPMMAMGLIHANRKRKLVAWGILTGVVTMVLGVGQLPPVWRGVVDLGVVIGLASGIMSVLWFALRAAQGVAPSIAPDLPEVSHLATS